VLMTPDELEAGAAPGGADTGFGGDELVAPAAVGPGSATDDDF